MWTRGEGEGGMNWEVRFDINTLPCVKLIATGNLRYSPGSSARCCDDRDGWDEGVGGREIQEGGDICIRTADSLHCTAETNTIL